MGKSYWMNNQVGNFSNNGNDTFNPEKDYIGIRLEQGVPLLDRDWNELEDIRRYQEMILRRWYIGDGTPDNGFKITANTADLTKIEISPGRYLVDGFEAVNDPENPAKGLTLGTYEEGKYDLVYLDLWISEIHGTPELKNSQDVNVETCTRHKIEWNVKIIENISMDEHRVFKWDEIPGNGDKDLRDFLITNFYIDWIKDVIFKKRDDNKTITASKDENTLSLILYEKEKKATLEINGDQTYEFMANDKREIYDEQLDYLTNVLNELEKIKDNHHHYSPLALLDRSYTKDTKDPLTIVIDLRSIGNRAPISHSLSSKTEEIKIEPGKTKLIKEYTDDMIPCSPYRYMIWAKVENGKDNTPGNPARSSLVFYRYFLDYKQDIDVGCKKDSKSIEIKSEYYGSESNQYTQYNQYISDHRPFRPGKEIKIRNEGKNVITIKRIGFMYTII